MSMQPGGGELLPDAIAINLRFAQHMLTREIHAIGELTDAVLKPPGTHDDDVLAKLRAAADAQIELVDAYQEAFNLAYALHQAK
jgi:hypothetical protein